VGLSGRFTEKENRRQTATTEIRTWRKRVVGILKVTLSTSFYLIFTRFVDRQQIPFYSTTLRRNR